MADLDFGFLNILYGDKKGLIYQKYFLDRLAPIFFPPRVARLVELRGLDSRICSIVLPLGPGNPDCANKYASQSGSSRNWMR